MKNIFVILIFCILISSLIYCGWLILQKNRQIIQLEFKMAQYKTEINNCKKNIKPEEHKLNPIEIKVQKCMQECNYTTFGMSKCVDDSIKDWENEINDYLQLLDKTLSKEQYELLIKSQNFWNEYKTAQWNLANSIYSQKAGTIYINILSGIKSDIVEDRAMFLREIYSDINE